VSTLLTLVVGSLKAGFTPQTDDLFTPFAFVLQVSTTQRTRPDGNLLHGDDFFQSRLSKFHF
jgi:hypothetical protein